MLTNLTISYPDFKISEVIEPDHFDTNNADIKKKIDAIIAVLNQLTDATTSGASGADAISLTAIAPYTSTKLQAFLTEVITKLKSTGGSAEIGTPSIAGVTGTTVSAQLASLKSLLDGHATRLTTAEGKITSLETRATNVEGRATTLENRSTSLETRATNLENNKTDKTTTTALTTRVSAVETGKTDNATTSALDGRVGTLESGKADKSTTYTRTDVDSKLSAKTNLTGDHKGTWHGLTPGSASEAINGARLDVLEAQNVESTTLANGANTFSSVVQEAPLKVLSTKGKTVVNLLGSSGNYSKSGVNTWQNLQNVTLDSAKHYILKVHNPVNMQTIRMIHSDLSTTFRPNLPTETHVAVTGVKAGTWTFQGLPTDTNAASFKAVFHEITQAEYDALASMTPEQVAQKYPYVESIKGIVNPTIEANGTREVVETTLHAFNGLQDELFRDVDGRLKKKTRFREMILDGSFTFAYSTDMAGHKRVKATIGGALPVANGTDNIQNQFMIKFDGKVMEKYTAIPVRFDQFILFGSGSSYPGEVYLSVPDADSGWGESYIPTADEIKAYFYGWKMYDASQAGYPPYNGTGQKYWMYRDTRSADGSTYSGGTGVLPTTYPPVIANWQPYKLVYQLATERIEEVATSGQVMLEEGNDTVELKQGVIVRERVSPVGGTSTYGNQYLINFKDAVVDSKLKFGVKSFISIYKNDVLDTGWSQNTQSNGNTYMQKPSFDFDPTATYYVTYEILPELTAKAEPMQVEYASSLKSLVESNTRQIVEHEERLDFLSKKNELTWFPFILQNGWVNYGGSTGVAAYRVEDDKKIIRLKGIIKSGTVTDATLIAQLPPTIRPVEEQWLSIETGDGTSRFISMLAIRPDGTLRIYGAKSAWIALDNITMVLI